jgi:hypothetical protein
MPPLPRCLSQRSSCAILQEAGPELDEAEGRYVGTVGMSLTHGRSREFPCSRRSRVARRGRSAIPKIARLVWAPGTAGQGGSQVYEQLGLDLDHVLRLAERTAEA